MAKKEMSYGSLKQEHEEDTTGDYLTVMMKLSNELVDLMDQEAELAEQADKLKKQRVHLGETKIPALMQERGMLDFTMTNGKKLSLKETIHTKIPESMKEDAMTWLEEHGHGGVIKRTIIIDFVKGEDAWANKFERDCAKRKKPLNTKRTKTVHAGTLKSLVTGMIGEGVDVPMKMFGVFRKSIVKVS